MPRTSQRYKNFLSSYNFYTNSINFRINSSKALEKFKNVQSFQLNQVINGKHFFKKDRREILLLKYDLWSRWLYEVENLFIELSGTTKNSVITEDNIELIVFLSDKTTYMYKHIILEKHNNNFDLRFTKMWLEIHEDSYQYLIKNIRRLSNLDAATVFTSIVDSLIEVMQHTLIEIYELDQFFCREFSNCSNCTINDKCPNEKTKTIRDVKPFIIFNDISKKCRRYNDTCLLCSRLAIYKKHFDIKEIFLKNYTEELIPVAFIEKIEQYGIKIDFKSSMIDEQD